MFDISCVIIITIIIVQTYSIYKEYIFTKKHSIIRPMKINNVLNVLMMTDP